MKKKITKIWSVGLVVVIAASLLLSAAPVSAGTLDWGTMTTPSTTGNVLVAGSNVADIAVSADGTMFAVTGTNNRTYKSTNGGETWSKLTKVFPFNPDYIAVAPDDSSILAVASASVNSTNVVYISTDGGSGYSALPATVGDVTTAANITGLAVSADTSGKNYVAVVGDDGSTADVWYFKIGDAAPSWEDAADEGGFGTATRGFAIAFSPNVASDSTLVAVTGNGVATVSYQMYSLSTKEWNSPFGADYPVEIKNGSNSITGADGAAVVLSPDFLGGDDALRIAFVGIATGSTAYAGVYRLNDTSTKDIYDASGRDIWSIDYDGSNLVAGNAVNDKVYRSSDPLASSPSFSTASSLKRPGTSGTAVNTKVVVAWNGADVVAGTTGTGSAFAVSRDDGKSFNDISLIDSVGSDLGNLDDVAVSPDGSTVYVLSRDANSLALWRNASSWERVLSLADLPNYIVRIAPEDPDTVYVVATGNSTAKTIYYSSEGGDTKWFTRTSRYAIQDMAVEDASVAYVAEYGSTSVSKTTNSGFTWGSTKPTGISGTSISMIQSLGEDELIVGSQGYVAYSTDGNSSWTAISKVLDTTGATQVTATGLSDGDFIYAGTATGSADSTIERWEVGVSTGWKDLKPELNSHGVYGIAVAEGALYAVSGNATGEYSVRTISPTSSEPSSGMWSTMLEAGQLFTRTPSALRVSSGSTKLWAVDNASTTGLYYFLDTLAVDGPTLSSPGDGVSLQINPVSGVAYALTFTIERPSTATIYDIQVSTNSAFTEKVVSTTIPSTTSSTPSHFETGATFMPDTTYYWRVRVNIAGPVRSPWSEVRSFTVDSLPEAAPPVIIQQPPAPVIEVPPTPEITIQAPEIVIPPAPPAPAPAPAPAPEIIIPPAPAPPAPITPAYIWAVIIIGAVLVIALIILIVRTRRPV